MRNASFIEGIMLQQHTATLQQNTATHEPLIQASIGVGIPL